MDSSSRAGAFAPLAAITGCARSFITPYTPEQNGLVERFFRSLKEECVWLYNFGSFIEARTAITKWIEWYNPGRPHQSLGYRGPRQFRALQPQLVA